MGADLRARGTSSQTLGIRSANFIALFAESGGTSVGVPSETRLYTKERNPSNHKKGEAEEGPSGLFSVYIFHTQVTGKRVKLIFEKFPG